MTIELKWAIANYIHDNVTLFGLHNATTNEFKAYIYDDEGEYLIGGEEVAEFIGDAIRVLA